MNAVALAGRRAGFEVREYFRSGDEVFFTFLFPLLMLAIFSAAFSDMDFGPGVDAAQYYLPGMIAAGILLSGAQNLSIDIAVERSDGTLKRLAGTPLPPISYILGKVGQMCVTGVAQTGLLIALAALVFRVPLPSSGAKWLTFAWVYVLGLATSGLLGVALARLPRRGKSASAVIAPIMLVLQFISGVYLPFSQLPAWMQGLAAAFPLKWMAQGMRSVFLPSAFASVEPAGAWELGRTAVVLAAWIVGGFVLARLTFRWIRDN